MDININNNYVEGIIIGAVGAMLATLIGYGLKKISEHWNEILSHLRRGINERQRLVIYQNHLEQELLCFSHPWLKEGQMIKDVLVTVSVETEESGEKNDLEFFLKNTFISNQSSRIVLLGKPGSGKTVAMRVIAKTILENIEEIKLIPVFMTFSDIRRILSFNDLEKKLVDKMNLYQFGIGANGNTYTENFVKDNLHNGKLLLIIDGYDELDKNERDVIANLLNDYLGTYRNVPAILSSREAVYKKEHAFDKLKPQTVKVSPFTQFTILKFISKWNFDGRNKSSIELYKMIVGKSLLLELASNPLMLTIITFLYSLPKYILPDNRVQFYEHCTRALLEEWDRAKDARRANKYEFHQKIAMLSRLAFDQLNHAKDRSELITEEHVYETLRREMGRLGLIIAEYPEMRDEIVLNSGLLQLVPPADYQFPHRTFMEYYAANYISTQISHEELIELYKGDQEKWRQVLLLYMGMNKNITSSCAILQYLKSEFTNSWESEQPSTIVFEALTECSVPDPTIAQEILTLANQYLQQRKIHKGIVEQLGFIAANPRWAYGQKAQDILLNILRIEQTDDSFHAVLFALLHANDANITKHVVANLSRINLSTIFSSASLSQKAILNKLLAINLPFEKTWQLIEGLKESGNVESLCSLMIESHNEDAREICALALSKMTNFDKFYYLIDALDGVEIEMLRPNIMQKLDTKYEKWGWKWALPRTQKGKKLASLICYFAAERILKGRRAFDESYFSDMSGKFKMLISGFLLEKGIAYSEFNILGYDRVAREKDIKDIWTSSINLGNLWYKICNLNGGRFWHSISYSIYILILCVCALGLIQIVCGITNNRFYEYLFDKFTVYYTAIFAIASHMINDLVDYEKYRIYKERFLIKNKWYQDIQWATNIVNSFYGAFEKRRYIYYADSFANVPFVALGVSFIHLFLPFHNIVFNIILSTYFAIISGLVYDDIMIKKYAILNTVTLRRISSLLGDGEEDRQFYNKVRNYR